MDLQVTDQAVTCLKEEWGFEEGEMIRVYVRYVSGGAEPLSLGINKDTPRKAAMELTAGGITFFMEENDVWFLDGRKLKIDAEGEEIRFEV